jgi:hypothetical protein
MYLWLDEADLDELPVTNAFRSFLNDSQNLISYDVATVVSEQLEELTRAVYGLGRRLVAPERKPDG